MKWINISLRSRIVFEINPDCYYYFFFGTISSDSSFTIHRRYIYFQRKENSGYREVVKNLKLLLIFPLVSPERFFLQFIKWINISLRSRIVFEINPKRRLLLLFFFFWNNFVRFFFHDTSTIYIFSKEGELSGTER